MIRRKWPEVLVEEIDFRPHVDTITSAKKWRDLAKSSNVLVKVKTDSTAAQDNGEIEIERCLSPSDLPIGILRSVSGDPTDFPKKFMASVAVKAWDCNCDGAGTGALADADFGRQIRSSPDGKARVVTSNAARAAIAEVATKYEATLAASGDFNIAEVGGVLSIVLHTAPSNADTTNINGSDVGRQFIIGTGDTRSIYAFASSYVTATKSIPVTHVSGPTTFTDGAVDLQLLAQVKSDARVIGGTHENLRLSFDFRDNFR